MPEYPYAALEMNEEGEVIGVRCPICGKLILATDPKRASEEYVLHHDEVHGVPS